TAEAEQDQLAAGFSLYDFIMHLNHGSLHNDIQSGVLPKAGGNRGNVLAEGGDHGDGRELRRRSPEVERETGIVTSNQKLNVLRPSLGRNLLEIVMALPCLVPAGNHRIETVGSVVEIQDFTERGIACMVSLVGTEGKADDQGFFQRVCKLDQVEE